MNPQLSIIIPFMEKLTRLCCSTVSIPLTIKPYHLEKYELIVADVMEKFRCRCSPYSILKLMENIFGMQTTIYF